MFKKLLHTYISGNQYISIRKGSLFPHHKGLGASGLRGPEPKC